MTQQEIRETLEKQLQLLSERSKVCESNIELCKLTEAILSILDSGPMFLT